MVLSLAEGLWAFGGILAASKEEALKKTTKANHPLTEKDNEHLC